MIAVLAILLFVAIGQASVKYPKNCSEEAITIASEYLLKYRDSFSSVECYQELIDCVGFDVEQPIAVCAEELNMPQLHDEEWRTAFLRSSTIDYFPVLQATCCVQTKGAEINNISLEDIQERIEECAAITCENSKK